MEVVHFAQWHSGMAIVGHVLVILIAIGFTMLTTAIDTVLRTADAATALLSLIVLTVLCGVLATVHTGFSLRYARAVPSDPARRRR